MQVRTLDPFYGFIRNFTEFTGKQIREGELERVKMCLNLVEKLLRNGGPAVKDAIFSVYLPALFRTINDCPVRTPLLHLLPELIRKEYERTCEHKEFHSDLTEFLLHLN